MMPYTTEELIDILEQELKAHWHGKKVLLSPETRIDNPVVAKAINLDKVGKVFAYQEFRQQIHAYQLKYQVSGVIWRLIKFQGQEISFPEIHNQLIPIPGDKEILVKAKNSVLKFWQRVTKDMKFWLVNAPGNPAKKLTPHQAIKREYLQLLMQEGEWAEIDAGINEIYLGLCWGDPQEYRYQWAKPDSGCNRIIAAFNQPSLTKI